jgi:hypothetical protein
MGEEGDFWDAYEGMIGDQWADIDSDANAAVLEAFTDGDISWYHDADLDNTMLRTAQVDPPTSLYYEDARGVCPLRITISEDETETEAGFMAMFNFQNVQRCWFDNEHIISSTQRDYETHYGSSDSGQSKNALQELFDHGQGSSYDFADAYDDLVDGYVSAMAAEAGDMNTPSVSYKQSPKTPISAAKASRFDTEKFSKTGASATAASTSTTVSSGEY